MSRVKRGLRPFFYFLVFLVGSFLFIGCNTPEKQVESPYKGIPVWQYEELNQTLKPGDVLLKHGYGTISRWISLTLAEEIPLSHCALVLLKTDSSIELLHSISGKLAELDGVQTITLKNFTKDVMQGSLIVLRKKEGSKTDELLANANQLLTRRVSFDHDFNSTDTTELYCSEVLAFLFAKTYNDAFFELVPHGEGAIYSFNSILHNQEFTIVSPKPITDLTTF